jgi:hypothetical protein
MKALARRAEERGLSLSEGFSDKDFLISTQRSSSSGTLKIVGILQFLGEDITGFKIADDVLPILSDEAVKYAQSWKQTAPIPTRIYSHILSAISNEVRNLKVRMGQLIGMYAALKSGEGVGRSAHTQWLKGVRCPSFNNLLEEFELLAYWPDSGAKATINGFSAVLHEAQVILSLQIQAYTGMRAEEVRNLPYDCLEESRRDGDNRIHYIVKGTVTKFTSGMERQTQWISIEAAAEAVRVAQQLAKAIYEADGITPNDLNSRKNGSLLFPTADCDGKLRNSAIAKRPADLRLTDRIRNMLVTTILESDQQELYAIDPHRAWSTEKAYSVGSNWHLHTHQLRRSLALYAQSSGLVSLPSLKRQLQHITVEMSLYYAKGSAFAFNFIGESKSKKDRHFGEEWQETQPVSQFLAYATTLLLSDKDDMFGGHGNWINARKRNAEGHILLNRNETLKSFQKGELAFRTTPLGGCVNTNPCERTPINVLSGECLSSDCKNLLASVKKVERLITIKTNTLAKLKAADVSSAEARIEEAELAVLRDSFVRAKRLN